VPSAGRPTGGAVNRFVFGGLELIPCVALIVLGAVAFYGKKLLAGFQLPLKSVYWGAKFFLGNKIPTLKALPKWGILGIFPGLAGKRGWW